MKKLAISVAAILCLSGCGKTSWETVSDTLPAVPVSSQIKEADQIVIKTPQDVQLVEATDCWNVYATDNGAFEVETRTFLASSLDAAISELSGFRADNLEILTLHHDDESEYRFAWVTNGEEETKICRARLIMNGVECYAVVCSINESVGDAYEEQIQEVFANTYISSSQGV